jgi:hypothetical protein
MVDADIKIKDCKHLEFGNPSAHTFAPSYLLITTFFLTYRQYSVKYGIKLSPITLGVCLNLIFTLIYLIGFSRVAKGVHTYNQVLSGLVLGTLMSITQSFILYKPFFKFYMSIRNACPKDLIFNKFTISFAFLFLSGWLVHENTK